MRDARHTLARFAPFALSYLRCACGAVRSSRGLDGGVVGVVLEDGEGLRGKMEGAWNGRMGEGDREARHLRA